MNVTDWHRQPLSRSFAESLTQQFHERRFLSCSTHQSWTCERTFIASFYNSWDRKNFSNLNWMEIDKGSPKSKGRDDFCLAPFLFEWPVACWTRQGKGRRVRPPHVICVFHLDCNCTFNSLCHLIGRDARMVVLLVENRKSKSYSRHNIFRLVGGWRTMNWWVGFDILYGQPSNLNKPNTYNNLQTTLR